MDVRKLTPPPWFPGLLRVGEWLRVTKHLLPYLSTGSFSPLVRRAEAPWFLAAGHLEAGEGEGGGWG